MPSCEPVPPAACLPTKTFRSYLPRCHRTYSCVHCRAHLAKHDELISKLQLIWLMWAVVQQSNVFCSLVSIQLLIYFVKAARLHWDGNMNKPSRPARSTKKGSTSLRCHIW
ncbi:hypothetical protein E2320_020554 [Naja naja]|nr:hypothetical protein E2320_020554 [Naja naja]